MWYPETFEWKPVNNVTKWTPETADRDVLKALERLPDARKPIPEELDLFDGATERRRQIYRDSVRLIGYDTYHGFSSGNAYEVARFDTSIGESGFVKGLWTWLDFNYTLSPISVTGTPFDPFVFERAGVQVIWHLRLTHQVEPIGPLWVGPWQQLPGRALPELNQWREARFLWGTPEGSVFLLVPRGESLRLFCQVVSQRQPIRAIGGRLWGYVQPATSRAAVENALHGWRA